MNLLPQKVVISDSNGRERITKNFKFHLKRLISQGADTNNESFCGYYPIGGNNGQLRKKISEVNCKKCLMLYKYLKLSKKLCLPFQNKKVK